jgi:hypothetical protein
MTMAVFGFFTTLSKLVDADPQRFQEIFTQNFARVDRIQHLLVCHFDTSMIIDDFNVLCAAITPFKADPPLHIDTYGILSLSVALQGMKPIPGIQHQGIQAGSRI